RPALNPPPDFGSKSTLALGEHQYDSHCASCHGNNGRVSSLFPDLRYAGELWSSAAFKEVVLGGAMQPGGMVSFRKVLTPHQADAIRAYIVDIANLAKKAPQRGFGGFGHFAFCGGPPPGFPRAAGPAPKPVAGTPPQVVRPEFRQ
ncbi:MAG: c-type cytochrome, partial [Steroidobacteraceae bacterium]